MFYYDSFGNLDDDFNDKSGFYSDYEEKNENCKEDIISTSKEIENDSNCVQKSKIEIKKITEEKESKNTEAETKEKNNIQIIEPKESFNINENAFNNEYNLDNINELKRDLTPFIKRKRGRTKKKNTGEEHTKFSDDNVRRKCKHILLDNLLDFINEKISEMYSNIGHGRFIKKLLIINQRQISNATILFNQQFLNKTIGDIFSDDISNRYTNYESSHNRDLISRLKNDEDETKKIYFQKLFNLKFIECLKHFRKDIFIPELEGLIPFQNLCLETIYETEYFENLKYYIMNYERIISGKRAREKK